MPLSEPVERKPLHQRDIQVRGYERRDGLYDIEGHLTDIKPYPIDSDGVRRPADQPIHGMWMRLTIDPAMTIVASEAWTEFGPFATCGGGATSYGRLVGLTLKPGFLRAANERLGGPAGCTHIREMLQQMATTAFQALWGVRSQRSTDKKNARATSANDDRDADGSIALVDTCYAYASDGVVVKARWPHLYKGRTASADEAAPAQAATGSAEG
jgi:hypothetical protein